MSRKYTVEYVRKSLFSFGYTLCDQEYVNAHTKMKTICPNGHEYNVSFTKWLQGSRCLCERGKSRVSIDLIKEAFGRKNWTVLDDSYEYPNKINYICDDGHKHSIRWDHFKAGHGCPYCAGRPLLTIETVRKSFNEENYILLSTDYINSNQKLEYICPNGHKNSITWSKWNTGYRCPDCAENSKKELSFISQDFKSAGYNLLSTTYKNNRQKLECVCPNGHNYEVSWSNWNSYHSRCPKCNEWGTSLQENSIVSFVRSICPDLIEHDRKLISPYELDIVVPSKRTAIEYCGLYWHSELAGKTRNYHFNKLKLCEEKNYRLITIFEDEFVNNRELVFSRLKNILSAGASKVVYARKCVVCEISTKEAKDFCNRNHIQGYGGGADIKLGAFYNNALVSVMTFSKPSLAKGSKNATASEWELHRFCSEIDTVVVGMASKILKYFEINYEWKRIFSYADCRWSVGNVYEKIGFTFIGRTKPNYWYIKKQNRLHRFALRKNKSDPKDMTEWEIRKAQGWNRIWDCGNLRYDKTNQ